MNIDEKIKRELESDAKSIDQIVAEEQGLFDMLFATFKGGMRRWVILMNVVIMAVTGLLLWCCYEFFTAGEMRDQVFWGVCFVVAANAQIAMKQWLWMEMNRSSLMREIKRVEIAVAKLSCSSESR